MNFQCRTPQPGSYAVAVFVAHGNGHDLDGIAKLEAAATAIVFAFGVVVVVVVVELGILGLVVFEGFRVNGHRGT